MKFEENEELPRRPAICYQLQHKLDVGQTLNLKEVQTGKRKTILHIKVFV